MKRTVQTIVALSVFVFAFLWFRRNGVDDRPESTSGETKPSSASESFTETPSTETGPCSFRIVRTVPDEAGTNRSEHAGLFRGIDDRMALSIAERALAGTFPPIQSVPEINRTSGETVVRWTARVPTDSSTGPEFVSVWIDNETLDVFRSPTARLSVAEAFDIARDALGQLDYDRTQPAEADIRPSFVQFTFPKRPGDGVRFGFAAKVLVSLETGAIFSVEYSAD